jgi:SAM-dependent methyltransferase
LQKIQCPDCGVLRQRPHQEEAKIEFYRDKYELYHQRPGTSESELARYTAIADWIFAELSPFTPQTVLDVGCGGGFLLDALMRNHPTAVYAGIDPSIQNSALARARGFSVVTGFTPGTSPPHERYDLVLASHVISHVADPLSFLSALVNMIAEYGRVVIFSHDGRDPGADHLFADVEFSFCREHLGALGAKVGLELLEGPRIPCPQGQLDKQVLVFQRSQHPRSISPLSTARRERLLEGRRQYFAAWEALADRLATRVYKVRAPVFNFGASFWSLLLAAYCPKYWERVDACVVDDGAGTFFGKSVLSTQAVISESEPPLIVLGINPANQTALAQRLAGRGEVVVWNDLITQ